ASILSRLRPLDPHLEGSELRLHAALSRHDPAPRRYEDPGRACAVSRRDHADALPSLRIRSHQLGLRICPCRPWTPRPPQTLGGGCLRHRLDRHLLLRVLPLQSTNTTDGMGALGHLGTSRLAKVPGAGDVRIALDVSLVPGQRVGVGQYAYQLARA